MLFYSWALWWSTSLLFCPQRTLFFGAPGRGRPPLLCSHFPVPIRLSLISQPSHPVGVEVLPQDPARKKSCMGISCILTNKMILPRVASVHFVPPVVTEQNLCNHLNFFISIGLTFSDGVTEKIKSWPSMLDWDLFMNPFGRNMDWNDKNYVVC